MTLQQQGFCFGFVEFEMASGKQSALEVNKTIAVTKLLVSLFELKV